MSGGSGYVLSREALRIFAEGQNDTTKCRQEDDHAEDVEMGRCLFNLGVKAGDELVIKFPIDWHSNPETLIFDRFSQK